MGERGRVGGAIVFIPLVLLPFITMFLSLLDFQGGMILCSILSLSVLTVLMLNPKLLPKKEDSELETYARKTVFHYLAPWVLFSVINGIFAPVITQSTYQRFPEMFLLLILLQNIVAPFGALMGGIFADLIGRRLTLMLGLTLYGISTAFSALSNIAGIVLFSSTLSGIAWGFFLVLYFLVVWGDLSNRRSRFSYYMSGFPFFISTGLSYFLTNTVFGISVENIIFFNVFLILLSNVPLIFAQELLPAAILQETSLRRFISRVKEIQEKN
jgi:MFS family permease